MQLGVARRVVAPHRPIARFMSTEKENTTPVDEEAPAFEEAKSILPPATEKVTGNTIKHDFQTETAKILSIVAQSLYTDREV